MEHIAYFLKEGEMPKFEVGAKVIMAEMVHPVLTVQFVHEGSVVCSYTKDGLIHTVELNPLLLEAAVGMDGQPLNIPVRFAL